MRTRALGHPAPAPRNPRPVTLPQPRPSPDANHLPNPIPAPRTPHRRPAPQLLLRPQARELAEDYGVRIFTADIIYHLFDQFTAYMKEIKSAEQEAARFKVGPGGGGKDRGGGRNRDHTRG